MQKMLFRGRSYEMPKVKKTIPWLIYTYPSLFKNKKNRVTGLFFKLEAFNCEVSFYRLTLTTVIVILMPEVQG